MNVTTAIYFLSIWGEYRRRFGHFNKLKAKISSIYSGSWGSSWDDFGEQQDIVSSQTTDSIVSDMKKEFQQVLEKVFVDGVKFRESSREFKMLGSAIEDFILRAKKNNKNLS